MPTPQLSRAFQLYLAGVIGGGVLVAALTFLVAPPHAAAHDAVLMSLLAGLVALTYLAPVKLAPKRQITVSVAFQTVAFLTLPLSGAMLCCMVGAAAGNAYHRRPWFNVLFNAMQNALAVAAAGAVYMLVAPASVADSERGPLSPLALLPAGAVLYLVTALAVDTAAAIQRRCSPFAGWRAVRGPTVVPHIALVLLGAAAAPAVAYAPWLLLLLAVPVVVIRSMLAIGQQFDAETVRLAEAAADAVHVQYPHRRQHTQRMVEMALRLARAWDLSEEQCQRIALAARLHDVAATNYSRLPDLDDALLDENQLDFLYGHAEDGATLIGAALNLPAVAEVLRFHHERYDGRGFPRGIRGEDIPYESCVLALAEAWVGLTSPRGHRPALTDTQALAVVRAGAGLQWHPRLTDTLAVLVEGDHASEVSASILAPAPSLARAVG